MDPLKASWGPPRHSSPQSHLPENYCPSMNDLKLFGLFKKIVSIHWFSLYFQSCKTVATINFRTISLLPTPISSPALTAAYLSIVYMNLSILTISCQLKKKKYNVAFCDWFLSGGIKFSRFIYIAV